MDTAKKRPFSIQDIGVALYLLSAFLFMIITLPSGMLDVMIALNISIAFVILFQSLFVKEVLDMSFYPTILLFTTIFRISLNISSTKLILTTGDPGNVVRTFGQFVGGNGSAIDLVCSRVQLYLDSSHQGVPFS